MLKHLCVCREWYQSIFENDGTFPSASVCLSVCFSILGDNEPFTKSNKTTKKQRRRKARNSPSHDTNTSSLDNRSPPVSSVTGETRVCLTLALHDSLIHKIRSTSDSEQEFPITPLRLRMFIQNTGLQLLHKL